MEFSEVRSEAPVAAVYACWADEPFLELVMSFADDVRRRSSLYPSVTGELSRSLAQLEPSRAEDVGWPGYERRHRFYRSVLTPDFFQSVTGLFSAVRRAGEAPREARSQRLGAQLEAFTAQVRGAVDDGAGLDTELAALREMYEHVSAVLADEQLAVALGTDPSVRDASGTSLGALKLVELMSDRVAEGGPGHLPLQQLVLVNDIARHGAQALARLLSDGSADSADSAHSAESEGVLAALVDWQEAVDDLIPPTRVVHLWHDPAARMTTLEQGHVPPSPAGPVRLPALQQYAARVGPVDGFQTMTVVWVCCSTGDLSCEEPDRCGPTQYPSVCTAFGTATCGLACALTSRFGGGIGGGGGVFF